MTMTNLSNALKEHFTDLALQIIAEELDKRLEELIEEADNGNEDSMSRLAVLSGLKAAIE